MRLNCPICIFSERTYCERKTVIKHFKKYHSSDIKDLYAIYSTKDLAGKNRYLEFMILNKNMFKAQNLEKDINLLHYYASKNIDSIIIRELVLYFYIVIITGCRFGVSESFINDPNQGLINIQIEDFVMTNLTLKLKFKSKHTICYDTIQTDYSLFNLFAIKRMENIENNRKLMFLNLANLGWRKLLLYRNAFIQIYFEYKVLLSPMAYRRARACVEFSNSLKQFNSYLEESSDLIGNLF